MAKNGTLILVKSQEPYPRLHPVTAVALDGVSGQVLVEPEVVLADGPTHVVPRELCFAFDPDLMETVNSLVGAAQDKLAAARQLLDLELEPAELPAEIDDEDLLLH